jgi:hypothetical protein
VRERKNGCEWRIRGAEYIDEGKKYNVLCEGMGEWIEAVS